MPVWISRAKIVVAAIAIVLLAIVILQNTEAVETRLLFAKITMPRAALLLVIAAIGFAAGLLVGTFGPRGGTRKPKG